MNQLPRFSTLSAMATFVLVTLCILTSGLTVLTDSWIAAYLSLLTGTLGTFALIVASLSRLICHLLPVRSEA